MGLLRLAFDLVSSPAINFRYIVRYLVAPAFDMQAIDGTDSELTCVNDE
jgi:hypothetical protein